MSLTTVRKHIPVIGNTIWKPVLDNPSQYAMLTSKHRLIGHPMCFFRGIGTWQSPQSYSRFIMTIQGGEIC